MILTDELVDQFCKNIRLAQKAEKHGEYHAAQILFGTIHTVFKQLWRDLRDKGLQQFEDRVREIIKEIESKN